MIHNPKAALGCIRGQQHRNTPTLSTVSNSFTLMEKTLLKALTWQWNGSQVCQPGQLQPTCSDSCRQHIFPWLGSSDELQSRQGVVFQGSSSRICSNTSQRRHHVSQWIECSARSEQSDGAAYRVYRRKRCIGAEMS